MQFIIQGILLLLIGILAFWVIIQLDYDDF